MVELLSQVGKNFFELIVVLVMSFVGQVRSKNEEQDVFVGFDNLFRKLIFGEQKLFDGFNC